MTRPLVATPREASTAMPWWSHQGLEYLIALLFISQAAHADADRVTVGALGISIALLAALTHGPLGIVHWLSLPVHRACDFFLIAMLSTAPVITGMTSLIGIAICEGAALVLMWLTLHTAHPRQPRSRPVEPTRRSQRPPSPADTTHPAYRAGRQLRKANTQLPHQIGLVIGQSRARRRAPGQRTEGAPRHH